MRGACVTTNTCGWATGSAAAPWRARISRWCMRASVRPACGGYRLPRAVYLQQTVSALERGRGAAAVGATTAVVEWQLGLAGSAADALGGLTSLWLSGPTGSPAKIAGVQIQFVVIERHRAGSCCGACACRWR